MRFSSLLGALVLAVSLLCPMHHKDAKAKTSSMELMQEQLVNDFYHFNNGYFDGNLPPTKISYTYSMNGDIGDSLCDLDDSGIVKTNCLIIINGYYDRSQREADLTLFHEMCHVATPIEIPDHGPKWQACMHNLANENAFNDLW